MSYTHFNRHFLINNFITEYFIKNNLKSFCSAACSYGCDTYDFTFELINRGYYNSDIKIYGFDIRKDIINSINNKDYHCIIQSEWSRKDCSYPYPVFIKEYPSDYYGYFFDKNLILKQEYKSIPNFYIHNLKEQINEKYDIVTAFFVLHHLFATHVYPYFGQKNNQDVINVLENLLHSTKKLLVLDYCNETYKHIESGKIILSYLESHNITYEILNEYLLIYIN